MIAADLFAILGGVLLVSAIASAQTVPALMADGLLLVAVMLLAVRR